MSYHLAQFRYLIKRTLRDVDLPRKPEAIDLLLGNAAQESHLGTYLRQTNGPGICGVCGTMTWRMLDLFSGLGGFTLAAYEVWGDDLETVSFVEIDKRCRDFLGKAWPGVPIHEDIKTLYAKQWRGTIDLLTGGVPCQPASRAGKQRGKDDDRWLWDSALRVCEECLPTWCLFENPPGIGDVGLDGILSALEGIGYEVQTVDIPACGVGSPQRRHRYWIICWLGNSRHKKRVCQPNEEERGLRCSCNESASSSRGDRHLWNSACCPGKSKREVCKEQRVDSRRGIKHLANLHCKGCEGRGVQPGVHGCKDAGEHRATHAKDSQGHLANHKSRGQRTDRSTQGSSGHSDFSGEDHECVAVHMQDGPEHEREHEHGVEQGASRGLPDRCHEDGWRQGQGVLLEHTKNGKSGEIRNESGEEGSRSLHELPGVGIGLRDPWSNSIWMPCCDGKVRRVPDDTQRMDHGLPVELSEALGEEGRENWTPEDCEPHRSLLGALGNSIVPHVAVEIMRAIKEASR